ncbi:hypothetical protein DSECCO2_511650 [anaerobic digester metagenome]
MCPEFIAIRPVIPCTSSDCPLPSIPAIQRISPFLTSKETFFTTLFLVNLLVIVMFFTSRTGLRFFTSDFSIMKLTFLPTIISDICSLEVVFTSTVPMYLPFLSTVHLSAASFISFSLCVMNIMDFPSSVNSLIIFISSSISCWVSTAVGSSKINMSLSL